MPSPSLQALLVRAGAALERGRGAEAAQMLAPQLRSSALTRDEELTVRSIVAEAALLQDDLDRAGTALGRPPDTFRDTIPSRRLARYCISSRSCDAERSRCSQCSRGSLRSV